MTVLLDADVILIDNRYPRDPKFTRNQELLNRLKLDGHEVAITVQALLEVVGILSYITAVARIPGLPDELTLHYGLKMIPDRNEHPNYAGITIADVVSQMSNQMSLNDAVQAVQIRMFAPHADALLTWNAKHFRGKLVIPVLTPEEWLQQQTPQLPPPAPPTP